MSISLPGLAALKNSRRKKIKVYYKQSGEPMKTWSKRWRARRPRQRVQARHDWFWLSTWLNDKVERIFLSQSFCLRQWKPKSLLVKIALKATIKSLLSCYPNAMKDWRELMSYLRSRGMLGRTNNQPDRSASPWYNALPSQERLGTSLTLQMQGTVLWVTMR